MAVRFGNRRPREPLAPERAASVEACREAALKLLERSRRTRSDLTRRLRDKGYVEPVIEQVLERLAGVGLVDDGEYARAYLRGRWGRRAAGWRRLEQDLRTRGVGADDIAAARRALEADVGPADEVAAARRVLEQARRRLERRDPRERRRLQWALLMRRGFDPETITAALGSRDDALGE